MAHANDSQSMTRESEHVNDAWERDDTTDVDTAELEPAPVGCAIVTRLDRTAGRR